MIDNSVFVQMTNGFGNNIFQYVAARLLSEFHNNKTYAIAPTQDYYAISCLEKLGIQFSRQSSNNRLLYVSDNDYIQAFNSEYSKNNFLLSGYFEDYKYYLNHRDMIKSWFSKVENRQNNDLVIHIRTGDRLFMKNEFYTKPKISSYLNAVQQFDFENLHIVTDMPKWDYITAQDLKNIKFHRTIPDDQCVPIDESVEYFNSFVDGFKQYKPDVQKRSVGEDFNFIRSFKNILFEHGTLSWWAAFLSDAEKVGVYGPWRPFKGNKNKNLSQIPLDGWFKWE